MKPMKILVACEESQVVTIELRRLGHEAYSCDIIEQSGGHPEWHIMRDVLPLLNGRCLFTTTDGVQHEVTDRWDMIIAFPPCTHLAVSGAKHFEKKRADGRQREAVEFFCQFLIADCDRIVIENPVGIISGEYVKTYYPDLAEKYGGGGHACAAGATVHSKAEMKQLLAEADELLRDYKKNNEGWL